MTTTHPAYVVRRGVTRLLVAILPRTLRLSRRVTSWSSSPTRVETARHPAGGSITISTVDDPDGTMHLIGVRGTVTERNAHRLFGAAHRFGSGLGRGLGLHIDLTQATIPTADSLRHLEMTIDELERRGFRLRVVGVDPAHPALVASR
jgi:hypothetical protein